MHFKVHKSNSPSHKKLLKLCISNNSIKRRKMTSESVLSSSFVLCVTLIAVVKCSEMCEPALHQLVKHGVATPDLMHHLPSNGSEVCRGGPCCLPSMSEKMLSRGPHLLHSAMQREATTLLQLVTIARDAFRDAVEAALHRSEERTLETLRVSYPRLIGHAKEPLAELFASLQASLITTEEDSVNRALDTFWDDMFPLVYHSTVHSRLPPFTDGYMECLRKSRKTIKPWKVIPSMIGQSLKRGLDTARIMVTTLNVISDVVLNARHYDIPEECGNSAARLFFCGSCQGVLVLPCSGFCLNVARGCLAPMAELNGMWNTMGTATVRINEAIQVSGLASLLKELPEKFSDAIMIAMESGNKLQKLVRNKCGPYTHKISKEFEALTQEGLSQKSEASLLESYTDVEGKALNDKAKEAAAALSGTHNYWKNLADKICSRITSKKVDCWNGDKIASYNRQVARVGVSAQKYNPEVQVLKPDVSVYALSEQMRNVKRMITKVLSWMPESASSRRTNKATEGSGYEDNFLSTDDEDGEDELGSGSYPLPKKNYNDLDQGDPTKTATQGASHVASSTLMLALTAFSLYLRRPNWIL